MGVDNNIGISCLQIPLNVESQMDRKVLQITALGEKVGTSVVLKMSSSQIPDPKLSPKTYIPTFPALDISAHIEAFLHVLYPLEKLNGFLEAILCVYNLVVKQSRVCFICKYNIIKCLKFFVSQHSKALFIYRIYIQDLQNLYTGFFICSIYIQDIVLYTG